VKAILAFFLLVAAAFAQKSQIIFQNLATARQTAWVFVGIPTSHLLPRKAGYLTDSETIKAPYVREERGIRVLVSLAAGQTVALTANDADGIPEPFAFHPAISSNLLAIAPSFFLGDEAPTPPTLDLVRASAAAQVWRIRAHWPTKKVTVDCWATVLSGSPVVEFVTHAVYGTTSNDGQAQVATFSELSMVSAAKLHPDFVQRNGGSLASWSAGPKWTLTLVAAGTRWHRASRFETRGAILAMPDEVREQARPMQGLYTGWQGSWMALGQIPAQTADMVPFRAQLRAAYLNPQWGAYSQSRPRAQMQTSGTTGEQPDFGWASDLAVVTNEPWEIHDALWQCQSFAQRPTGNREPGGAPMQARLHPKAETINQRPDLGWGPEDRLGWPGVNQIGWIPAPSTVLWTTSDDQHRADNLLHATLALTRDPALEAIVADHIQLDQTDWYLKNDAPPSPRAVGRLGLTRANQLWLGFADAQATLRDGLDAAARKWPVGQEPAIEEAKYGWQMSDGSGPVYGWQPWQKAIELGGFRAAAMVTKDPRYMAASRSLAIACVQQGWKEVGTAYWHAYALRWTPDAPRWPTALNRDNEGWTDDVYVSSAAASWTVAACVLLADEKTPVGIQAKRVVTFMGAPKNASESRWRAIR
jgi:hypothetical protein